MTPVASLAALPDLRAHRNKRSIIRKCALFRHGSDKIVAQLLTLRPARTHTRVQIDADYSKRNDDNTNRKHPANQRGKFIRADGDLHDCGQCGDRHERDEQGGDAVSGHFVFALADTVAPPPSTYHLAAQGDKSRNQTKTLAFREEAPFPYCVYRSIR